VELLGDIFVGKGEHFAEHEGGSFWRRHRLQDDQQRRGDSGIAIYDRGWVLG
jgi:hypothetical protein